MLRSTAKERRGAVTSQRYARLPESWTTMNELCLQEVCDIVGGRLRLGAMPPIDGELASFGQSVLDVEQVTAGDVFWELPNIERMNQGGCAQQAFARGAVGAVVSRRGVEPWAGGFTIEVEDTAWALWQLARCVREDFQGTVIASANRGLGAIETAMIDHVLGQRWSGPRSQSTVADPIELALQLTRLSGGADYGLFAMTAEQESEIPVFSHLCSPEIAVINGLTIEHDVRGSNGSDIAAAWLQSLATDSCAIIDGDHAEMLAVAKKWGGRVLAVGRDIDCDVVARDVCCRDGKLTFDVDGIPMVLPVWGRHYLKPALAAVGVARLLGMDGKAIAAALKRFATPERHCQVLRAGEITVVDDTCDASPQSTLAALNLLGEFKSAKQRIVVLGEIKSPVDAVSHQERIGKALVAVCGADLLISCGTKNQRLLDAAIQAGMSPERTVVATDETEMIDILKQAAKPGDVVLVKGCEQSLQSVVTEMTRTIAARAA